MKIRADFVTNSSSSSFVTIQVYYADGTCKEREAAELEPDYDALDSEKIFHRVGNTVLCRDRELHSLQELSDALESIFSLGISVDEGDRLEDVEKIEVICGTDIWGGDAAEMLESMGFDFDEEDEEEYEEDEEGDGEDEEEYNEDDEEYDEDDEEYDEDDEGMDLEAALAELDEKGFIREENEVYTYWLFGEAPPPVPVPESGSPEFAVYRGTLAEYNGPGGMVAVPEGVRSIREAFEGRSDLTGVSFPDGLREIGESAFSECTGLTALSLPDSLKNIGADAFYGCAGLTEVVIPEGVTKIDDEAFSDCTRLASVTLPETLKYIGCCAFCGCTALKSVVIPAGVEEMDSGAFGECTVIHAPAGSYAEAFAKENGLSFQALPPESN